MVGHENILFLQRKIPVLERLHFDGLAQDCSDSIANALELLQSYTKPSIS